MNDPIYRIDKWLKTNRPEYHSKLRPGVSKDELDAFERQFELLLPDSFRALYMWRDGQDPDVSDALLKNHMFIPLSHSASSKDELDGMIGSDFDDPAWWRRGWVPFTESYGGDHECLDIDAAGGGMPGQVISFWHDDASRIVRADSLEAWLAQLADKMETGG